jgi:hypothetical protein
LGREEGMLWFFPKKYFDAEFSRKDYFYMQNPRKTYSDARLSSIKIAFFFTGG